MDIGERGYGGSEGQSSLSVVAADDQKLDAAAALTAFAQVGFQSTSNRTVEIPNSSSNSAAADPYYGNEGKNNDVMNGSNHGGGSGGGRYDHSGLSHDRPNAGASHEEHHRSVSATTGAYSRSTAAPLHSHENDPMVRNDDRGMPPYAASTYPEINDRHHDRDNDRATSSYHPTNAYYHHSSNNNNGENKKDESDHRNSLNSETSHSAALGYGSSVPPVDRNNIPHQQSHPNVFQAHSIFPHYAGKEPSQPSGLDISYKAEEELVKEGDADVETEEEADSDVDEEADEPLVQTVQQPVRGKPEAIARAHAAARVKADRASEREGSPSPTNEIRIQSQYDSAKETKSDTGKKRSSKKTASTKKTSSPEKKPPSNRKKSSQSSALVPKQTGSTIPREFLLGEVVPPITEAEYENLKNLMTQFCRVPLLSEFSRPVSILHPEVSALQSQS